MEDRKNKKVKDIIRNIFGGIFIFTGFANMFSNGSLTSILMVLFGISLLPVFYKKIKLNIKQIQIILPIILLIILGMVMPNTTNEINSDIDRIKANMIRENKNIEITNLKFNESEIELDIKETKNAILEIIPEKANTKGLELCTSNSAIAILEKKDTENNENRIALKIKPISEGICEIFVKSANGIKSNKVTLKIIDNERIEQERKAKEEQIRKEAEEQAKKEAEEQAKREKEEQERKQAEEQAKQKTTTQSSTTITQKSNSSSQSNSNNTHGKVVYRTPSGKRYHFDPDCGGKNSYQTTLDAAKSSGLTPCKKCAY